MVCQAAGQTRFRALKYENGIAGSATIVVRVIACFQPLQDCQVCFLCLFLPINIIFVSLYEGIRYPHVWLYLYFIGLHFLSKIPCFFLLLMIDENVHVKSLLNFVSWVFARLNIFVSCLSPLRRLLLHFFVQVKLEFLVFSFVFERNCK